MNWDEILGNILKSSEPEDSEEKLVDCLPEDMEGETIANMINGDRGYTVPWAMWVDMDRKLWINTNYDIEPAPCGTVEMLIEKRNSKYFVHKRTITNQKYTPEKSPCFYGGHKSERAYLI